MPVYFSVSVMHLSKMIFIFAVNGSNNYQGVAG